MKLRYLLDTNICIYIAKKKPLEVYQRPSTLNIGEVGMSAITFGELRYGAEKSQHREIALQKLAQLEQYIPVVVPTKETAEHYGIIRCFLEKQGQPIGNNDLWIAAHALSLNIVLVTNNTKEFIRVPKEILLLILNLMAVKRCLGIHSWMRCTLYRCRPRRGQDCILKWHLGTRERLINNSVIFYCLQ